MAVPSTIAGVDIATDGTAATFPLSDGESALYFANPADLKAWFVDADGAATALIYGTDFTVGGDGTAGTGTLTTIATHPGASGIAGTIAVRRQTNLAQQFTWRDGDGNPSARFESAEDRDRLIDQDMRDQIGRTLRAPDWARALEPIGDFAPAKLLQTDDAGNVLTAIEAERLTLAPPGEAGPAVPAPASRLSRLAVWNADGDFAALDPSGKVSIPVLAADGTPSAQPLVDVLNAAGTTFYDDGDWGGDINNDDGLWG